MAIGKSTTPFQTERNSRPRHLAASFPFPLTLKIEKHRCLNARFSGGLCIKAKSSKHFYMKLIPQGYKCL